LAVTVLLAVPLAPDVIATQLLSLDAVQLHPVNVVRPTATGPPSGPTVSWFLLSE
jgi:hypothetical protein